MIGRADIEGSKSNVAMNAWLPQASYPCGTVTPTHPLLEGRMSSPGSGLVRPFLQGLSLDRAGLYLKALPSILEGTPHRHLVSEGSPWAHPGRSFPADHPDLQRSYRTLGRYPGHRRVSTSGLVVGALRASPHFDGVAAGSLALSLSERESRPTPELTGAPRRRLAPPFGGTKANHVVTFLTPLASNPEGLKDR